VDYSLCPRDRIESLNNECRYQLMEQPLPTPTGTEVLIRTTFAGVCHSELHMWEGKWNMGGGDEPSSPLQILTPLFKV
jgi:D-arabinose 1-dehydrogenase-like Zn-dependent alcohol dehydrogenase